MGRKKITLALIKYKTHRKASFRKRRKGLIKKVREISTLCDVDACAIVFSPYDQKVDIWPSLDGAMAVLARYGAMSGIQQLPRKELDPETFTLQRLWKTQQKVDRLCDRNKRSDLELFMYQCMAGMNRLVNLDARDYAEMDQSIDQVLRDVTSKIRKLDIGGGDSQAEVMAPPPPPVAVMGPPPPPVAVMGPPPPPLRTESESSGLSWDIEALLHLY